MTINQDEPLYVSFSKSEWERTQGHGRVFTDKPFTNSMRIAELNASVLAKTDKSKKGVVVKIHTGKLLGRHGIPNKIEDRRHRENENSFLFGTIVSIISFIEGFYEVAEELIEIIESDLNY